MKLIDSPNTYVFSKRITETMIDHYKNFLPLVIFRPSIIFSSEREPAPGYIANFNGPVGLLLATACGVMRTMYIPRHGDPKMSMVPIDTCSNGIIVAAYARHQMGEGELPIYNASTKKLGIIEIIRRGKRNVFKHPPKFILWKPGGWITHSKIEFIMRVSHFFNKCIKYLKIKIVSENFHTNVSCPSCGCSSSFGEKETNVRYFMFHSKIIKQVS